MKVLHISFLLLGIIGLSLLLAVGTFDNLPPHPIANLLAAPDCPKYDDASQLTDVRIQMFRHIAKVLDSLVFADSLSSELSAPIEYDEAKKFDAGGTHRRYGWVLDALRQGDSVQFKAVPESLTRVSQFLEKYPGARQFCDSLCEYVHLYPAYTLLQHILPILDIHIRGRPVDSASIQSLRSRWWLTGETRILAESVLSWVIRPESITAEDTLRLRGWTEQRGLKENRYVARLAEQLARYKPTAKSDGRKTIFERIRKWLSSIPPAVYLIRVLVVLAIVVAILLFSDLVWRVVQGQVRAVKELGGRLFRCGEQPLRPFAQLNEMLKSSVERRRIGKGPRNLSKELKSSKAAGLYQHGLKLFTNLQFPDPPPHQQQELRSYYADLQLLAEEPVDEQTRADIRQLLSTMNTKLPFVAQPEAKQPEPSEQPPPEPEAVREVPEATEVPSFLHYPFDNLRPSLEAMKKGPQSLSPPECPQDTDQDVRKAYDQLKKAIEIVAPAKETVEKVLFAVDYAPKLADQNLADSYRRIKNYIEAVNKAKGKKAAAGEIEEQKVTKRLDALESRIAGLERRIQELPLESKTTRRREFPQFDKLSPTEHYNAAKAAGDFDQQEYFRQKRRAIAVSIKNREEVATRTNREVLLQQDEAGILLLVPDGSSGRVYPAFGTTLANYIAPAVFDHDTAELARYNHRDWKVIKPAFCVSMPGAGGWRLQEKGVIEPPDSPKPVEDVAIRESDDNVLTAIKQGVKNLQDEIERLRKEFEPTKRRIESLEDKTRLLKAQGTAAVGFATYTNTDDKSSHERDIELTKRIREVVRAEVGQLAGEIATLAKQVPDLKADFDQLAGNIPTLAEQVSDLKAAVAQTETEIATLRESVNSLVGRPVVSVEMFEELQKNIQELASQQTTVRSQLSTLMARDSSAWSARREQVRSAEESVSWQSVDEWHFNYNVWFSARAEHRDIPLDTSKITVRAKVVTREPKTMLVNDPNGGFMLVRLKDKTDGLYVYFDPVLVQFEDVARCFKLPPEMTKPDWSRVQVIRPARCSEGQGKWELVEKGEIRKLPR